MGRISLDGLKFNANHGVYEEERVNGNVFSVDVSFDFDFKEAGDTDDLSLTIDYELVYAIVAEIMSRSAHLLEFLAQHIAKTLKSSFPDIHNIEVRVAKFNPPIQGECHKAEVLVKVK